MKKLVAKSQLSKSGNFHTLRVATRKIAFSGISITQNGKISVSDSFRNNLPDAVYLYILYFLI